MRPGDLLFVRGKGPLSSVIRYFDPGAFSHVAVALSPTHVLEAQYLAKVAVAPNFYTDYELIDLGLTHEERDKVIELGLELVGRHYDYLQIAGYLFKTGWNNPKNLICSEVVETLLLGIGKLPEGTKLGEKPNELYQNIIKLRPVPSGASSL